MLRAQRKTKRNYQTQSSSWDSSSSHSSSEYNPTVVFDQQPLQLSTCHRANTDECKPVYYVNKLTRTSTRSSANLCNTKLWTLETTPHKSLTPRHHWTHTLLSRRAASRDCSEQPQHNLFVTARPSLCIVATSVAASSTAEHMWCRTHVSASYNEAYEHWPRVSANRALRTSECIGDTDRKLESITSRGDPQFVSYYSVWLQTRRSGEKLEEIACET
jgi:hypothetical protein